MGLVQVQVNHVMFLTKGRVTRDGIYERLPTVLQNECAHYRTDSHVVLTLHI